MEKISGLLEHVPFLKCTCGHFDFEHYVKPDENTKCTNFDCICTQFEDAA